jgi:hypothetical protein
MCDRVSLLLPRQAVAQSFSALLQICKQYTNLYRYYCYVLYFCKFSPFENATDSLYQVSQINTAIDTHAKIPP